MDDFLGNYIKESFPVPIGQNIYKLTGSNAWFLGRQNGLNFTNCVPQKENNK